MMNRHKERKGKEAVTEEEISFVTVSFCSLSELLSKKPQKNEIKKDTPGYGGKPRKYWGYGGCIKRKIHVSDKNIEKIRTFVHASEK